MYILFLGSIYGMMFATFFQIGHKEKKKTFTYSGKGQYNAQVLSHVWLFPTT